MKIVGHTLRRTGLLAVAILGLATAAAAQDTATRLKELQSLYDQKLITESEFQSRRQGLLDAIAPAMAPAGNGGIVPPHLGGSPVPVKAFDLKDVQGKWVGESGDWTVAVTIDGNRLSGIAECRSVGGPAYAIATIDHAGNLDGKVTGPGMNPRTLRGVFPKISTDPAGSCRSIEMTLSRKIK